jgi:hypothetical protein
MTKNPLINAITAVVYVAVVASIIFFGPKIVEPKQSILLPITFLSLFTLSAVVMASVFFYQPIALLIEGNKAVAFKLALHTILYFAVITAILFGVILLTTFLNAI